MLNRKNKIQLLKDIQKGKVSVNDLQPKYVELKIGLPPYPKFLADEKGKPILPKTMEEIYI